MEEKKATSPPPPGSKEGRAYAANVMRACQSLFKPDPTQETRQLYIPRPNTLASFSDATVETVLDAIKIEPDSLLGWEHRYGGKVIQLATPEAAEGLRHQFPINVVVGKSAHRFELAPVPPIFSGVRVRVMGLPVPTDAAALRELAEALADNPKDLLHVEQLRSRRGVPIDKATLVYAVCPFYLLVTRTMTIGPYQLQFVMLNREASCSECGHAGHFVEHCPVARGVTLLEFVDESDDEAEEGQDPDPDKPREKDKGGTAKGGAKERPPPARKRRRRKAIRY